MPEAKQKAIEVLRSVLTSKKSDFYRNIYATHDARLAASIQAGSVDWEQVPLLERRDIAAVPFKERLYIEWHELGAIRPTSGTSGKGIMCMGRTADFLEQPSLIEKVHREIGITRIASQSGAQFIPAATTWRRLNLSSVAIDPSDHVTSAHVIHAFKADALFGPCHSLIELSRLLRPEDCLRMKMIFIFGEWSSSVQRTYLQVFFPNACIVSEYASIDAQTSVALSCTVLAKNGGYGVHPIPNYVYTEIVDESGIVKENQDESGELVLTVIRDAPLPLVRYRTGDRARIINKRCPCGIGTPVLSIEGRLEYDRIRIAGGEVNLAEIDRTLSTIAVLKRVPFFQVAVRDVRISRGVVPQVVFRLAGISATDAGLAGIIASTFRVAPHRTYAAGVEEGIYAPLVVEALAEKNSTGKPRCIVREHA